MWRDVDCKEDSFCQATVQEQTREREVEYQYEDKNFNEDV